jgi:hypothetical protein
MFTEQFLAHKMVCKSVGRLHGKARLLKEEISPSGNESDQTSDLLL